MKYVIRTLLAVLPLLAGVLVVTQVVITNELASLGKELGKLDYNVSVADEVYEDLATQVASASALFALRQRAGALGFREPTQSQIIPLVPEVPVALHIAQ